MAITLRAVTGSALTHNQVDTNFASYFYSASVSGSTLDLHYTGSSAIGLLPRSTSISLPSSSKWNDIAGGGISRNSEVQITGSTNLTGSVNIIGTLTQGFTGLQAFNFSHAEGYINIASGSYSHAEGNNTRTTGSYSHAEGSSTRAIGLGSHAEGASTQAIGQGSHAEGLSTITSGSYSHAEGYLSIASGSYSHAEGVDTRARGEGSHAEGQEAIASGSYSHAEGYQAIARGDYSHAEGFRGSASGSYSHTEGYDNDALGDYSHAEGYSTRTTGLASHAEGLGTVASGSYQHVQGQYNISSSAQSAFIIGNGTSNANRSNLVFASSSQFQISGSVNVSGAVNTVGDLTVQGNITAQQYIVSTSVYYVTESYSSGSHIFGNSLDDTHQFTGSLRITGSFQATGSVDVQGTLSAGTNVIAASTVQGATVYPTSALILDGFGNNGMKASGSTANIFVLNAFTVGSGSFAATNSAEYIRINSGGLTINNGFDLIAHGNKQFNYGMFFHTASISVANGSSGSVLLSTSSSAAGVSIVSGSRITVTNPGYYNIQFSAQLSQGSGAANYYLWFKKNGSNLANSNSIKTLATSTNQLMTVDIIDYASNAGDYYEIAHQSDNANSTILYSAASGNIPATPSIIVTVQQVR